MNFRKLFYIALITILFGGCSKKLVSEEEIRLDVDGHQVIKQKNNNLSQSTKDDSFFEKNNSTIDIIARACDLAQMKKNDMSFSELDHKEKKKEEIGRRSSIVTDRMLFTPLNNNFPIVCDSGRDSGSLRGCKPAAKGSEQSQYHLRLLELMQNHYGMKSSATWTYRTLVISNEYSNVLIESMSMDNLSYQCKSEDVDYDEIKR